MIYLLVYRPSQGRVELLEEYRENERDVAIARKGDLERIHIGELTDVEIALFETDSLESFQNTHSRYFRTLHELNDALRRTVLA